MKTSQIWAAASADTLNAAANVVKIQPLIAESVATCPAAVKARHPKGNQGIMLRQISKRLTAKQNKMAQSQGRLQVLLLIIKILLFALFCSPGCMLYAASVQCTAFSAVRFAHRTATVPS